MREGERFPYCKYDSTLLAEHMVVYRPHIVLSLDILSPQFGLSLAPTEISEIIVILFVCLFLATYKADNFFARIVRIHNLFTSPQNHFCSVEVYVTFCALQDKEKEKELVNLLHGLGLDSPCDLLKKCQRWCLNYCDYLRLVQLQQTMKRRKIIIIIIIICSRFLH